MIVFDCVKVFIVLRCLYLLRQTFPFISLYLVLFIGKSEKFIDSVSMFILQCVKILFRLIAFACFLPEMQLLYVETSVSTILGCLN